MIEYINVDIAIIMKQYWNDWEYFSEGDNYTNDQHAEKLW